MKLAVRFTPKSWGFGIGFDLASKSLIPYFGYYTESPAVIWIEFAMWTIDLQFGEYKTTYPEDNTTADSTKTFSFEK